MEFTPEITESLKHYVYIYSDPDTTIPFYIGKGYGNRCFQHLDDQADSDKVNKINLLREKNKEPIIELLRYGLTEGEASLLEATLIDFIGIDKLTNKVRGLHSKSFGRTAVEDIIITYTAEEVEIKEKVMLIKINRLYRSGMSEQELYEVTRGTWKVGKVRREKAKYAFSVFQGIVKEVYELLGWFPSGTLNYQYLDSSTFRGNDRWEFEGKKTPEYIRSQYISKSVRGYFKKGGMTPENCTIAN